MTQQVFIRHRSNQQKSAVPVTHLWKSARMVRHHSLRVACHEIIAMSYARDLIKINVIGDPGSGKTTLSEAMAHIIHKESKIPYAVKFFTKEELKNLREVLTDLPPLNYIFIFDDVSFLDATTSAKQIKEIESTITEIRHLPGHQDIKVIMFLDFHYTMAVPKYMRQSNIAIYTTIGTSDVDNAISLMKTKNTQKIHEFINIADSTLLPPYKFSVKLGKRSFSYDCKDPFLPALFYNKKSARLIVFPKREWIDPICTTCSTGRKKDDAKTSSIADFDKAISSKFGPNTIKRCIRLKLYMHGLSSLDKTMSRTLRFIDRWSEKNGLKLQDLAEYYKLDYQSTKLKVPKEIYDIKDSGKE